MKVNPKIDELLNSFIDGELPPRQQTEVQRLVAHDPAIAGRLRQLKKCRLLLTSLPSAHAPAALSRNIIAALERKTLLGEPPSSLEQLAGERQLFVRNLLAAAAIIALVAVLSVVIYNIVAPPTTPAPPAIATRHLPPLPEPATALPTTRPAQFAGRLELGTDSFIQVDASVSKAIAENDSVDCTSLTRQPDRAEYILACSRKGLASLLADLETLWDKLDSATLLVYTDTFGRQIAVNAVTADQVLQIAGQDSLERSIRVAKDFAALNNIVELLPGKDILTAIDAAAPDLITTTKIPKPVLTGWSKTIKKPTSQLKTDAKVSLAITVVADK
jgi:hypothetical protein